MAGDAIINGMVSLLDAGLVLHPPLLTGLTGGLSSGGEEDSQVNSFLRRDEVDRISESPDLLCSLYWKRSAPDEENKSYDLKVYSQKYSDQILTAYWITYVNNSLEESKPHFTTTCCESISWQQENNNLPSRASRSKSIGSVSMVWQVATCGKIKTYINKKEVFNLWL